MAVSTRLKLPPRISSISESLYLRRIRPFGEIKHSLWMVQTFDINFFAGTHSCPYSRRAVVRFLSVHAIVTLQIGIAAHADVFDTHKFCHVVKMIEASSMVVGSSTLTKHAHAGDAHYAAGFRHFLDGFIRLASRVGTRARQLAWVISTGFLDISKASSVVRSPQWETSTTMPSLFIRPTMAIPKSLMPISLSFFFLPPFFSRVGFVFKENIGKSAILESPL